MSGPPSRNRTCNTQLRRLVLYPIELWAGKEGGAGERNRTSDLRVTSALLYQLSYTGNLINGIGAVASVLKFKAAPGVRTRRIRLAPLCVLRLTREQALVAGAFQVGTVLRKRKNGALSAGQQANRWCPRPDSNRYADAAADFKSAATTYSATRAKRIS